MAAEVRLPSEMHAAAVNTT